MVNKTLQKLNEFWKGCIFGGALLIVISSVLVIHDNKECGILQFPDYLNPFACKLSFVSSVSIYTSTTIILSFLMIIFGIITYFQLKKNPNRFILIASKKYSEQERIDKSKKIFYIETPKKLLIFNISIALGISLILFLIEYLRYKNESALLIVLLEFVFFTIPLFRLLEFFATRKIIPFRFFVYNHPISGKNALIEALCYVFFIIVYIIIFLDLI